MSTHIDTHINPQVLPHPLANPARLPSRYTQDLNTSYHVLCYHPVPSPCILPGYCCSLLIGLQFLISPHTVGPPKSVLYIALHRVILEQRKSGHVPSLLRISPWFPISLRVKGKSLKWFQRLTWPDLAASLTLFSPTLLCGPCTCHPASLFLKHSQEFCCLKAFALAIPSA